MYSDAGAEFIAEVSPLLKLAAQQDVVGFQLQHNESMWTKKDTFVLLGADNLADTKQLLASFVLLKRSWMSLGFVSQWLAYAQDSRAVTDDPSVFGPNAPGFQDHGHDQSIFSLLYKKWSLVPHIDPSQFGNDNTSRPYPQIISHHRDKT